MTAPDRNASALLRAAQAIDRMKAKLDAEERRRTEPIAIIGVSCRFPGGCDTPESFFRFLHDGGDAIQRGPGGALVPRRGRSREPQGLPGGFLGEVDCFDPSFFGISPREAERLDPQQRLLLELTWGGPRARRTSRAVPCTGSKTGVFLGLMMTDYLWMAAGAEVSDWNPVHRHREWSLLSRRTSCLHLRLRGTRARCRHCLLLVPGRSPPRVPEPAQRGERPRGGRRRQPHALPGQHDDREDRRIVSGRQVQDLRRARERLGGGVKAGGHPRAQAPLRRRARR